MDVRGRTQVYTTRPDGSDVRWLGRLGHLADLAYSDTMPGGNEQLTCTLQIPPDFRDPALDPGRKVRACRGGTIQWDGILDEPTPADAGWQLTARGAGTWGGLYQAVWTSWTASDILTQAISRGLSWTVGSVGGGYLAETHDSGSMTVQDFLALYTSPTGMTWRVKRTPAGNQVDVYTIPSAVTRLLITTTPAARTLAGYVNAIYVRYQSSPNVTTGNPTYGLALATNPASIAKHNRLETFWDLSGAGYMTSGAASGYATQALAKYTAASWQGPFVVAPGQYLTTGGAPVDLGCEHAGEVARLILADGPYGGEVTPSPPVTFPVGKVEYKDSDGTATITPLQSWTADLQGVLTAIAPKPHP